MSLAHTNVHTTLQTFPFKLYLKNLLRHCQEFFSYCIVVRTMYIRLTASAVKPHGQTLRQIRCDVDDVGVQGVNVFNAMSN